MANPSLRDQPTKKWTAQDQDDSADHLKHRKPGEENPLDKPLKFGKRTPQTLNPAEENLKPEEMIGQTFSMPPTGDGSRNRAKIMESVCDMKDKAHKDPAHIKFRCLANNDFEEVVACNDPVNFTEKDTAWEGVWTFEKILSHEKVRKGNKDCRGAGANCLVLWSTGEQTWESPHDRSGKSGLWIDDPVMVAICARDNGLLDEPGWKLPGLKKIAKTQKKVIGMADKAKLHSFRSKPICMCGFQVPRNHTEALELDRVNGNTMWTDAETTELNQIDEGKSFLDKGVGFNPGSDCKRIRVCMVHAVKHDGRHKARLAAGGHLAETSVDSACSSVVSSRGARLLAFSGELNDLKIWSTGVGNACLETHTEEKVHVIAGPEFGDREGHVLTVLKVMCGLHSSWPRWSEHLADVLREMGFFTSKAEKDIWMRDKGDHCECIAVHVDDLLIASKDPAFVVKLLTETHQFKLKGTCPAEFHLGCDFFLDEEGVPCCAPKKHILRRSLTTVTGSVALGPSQQHRR